MARTLLAEIRMLRDQIDDAHSTWLNLAGDAFEEVTARLMTEFDTLPQRIASAMGAALQNQHRVIMTDVNAALKAAVAEMQAAKTTTNGA